MRTLTIETPLTALLLERVYTFTRLKAHPLTEPLAADFASLHEDWLRTLMLEVEFTETKAAAEAIIDVTDDDLDLLFNAIVNTLLILVDNDRSSALWVRFLGDQRPAEARKPVLGAQLELMRPWVTTLKSTQNPTLSEYSDRLAPLIKKADDAVTAQSAAAERLETFNQIGERKAFVDKLNALRKLTFGRLAELPHKHPEANLTADFAEQFFLRDSRSRGATLASEERVVQRLEEQLKKHRATLDELKAKQEATEKVRANAEQAALREELAALERETAAKLARAAALKAKLGDATP
jgi:hypothetical protein